MSELGVVCSCIQRYYYFIVGIVPLRHPDRIITLDSDNDYNIGDLVLIDSRNNIRTIEAILDNNVVIPWKDLFVSNTHQFDVWGDWLDTLSFSRFQEITNVIYQLSSSNPGLVTNLANTRFIKVFAKYAFKKDYYKALHEGNLKCYMGLCDAIFSSDIVLSLNEFRSVFQEVSGIPISITDETFHNFLSRNTNNEDEINYLLSIIHGIYHHLSEPLKIGFIKYLSVNKWPISVFINDDLTLTDLSKTLKDDEIYKKYNKTHKERIIVSSCISGGSIDKYIVLLNNEIIKFIAHSSVREAIRSKHNIQDKLSVLQEYVKYYKESEAIKAIEPINDSRLLNGFKKWAFNECIIKRIPEDSWDSFQVASVSPDNQFITNEAALQIIKRLLFWEQVRTFSQSKSDLDALNLDIRINTTILSLGGETTNNSEWHFFYDDALEELFYSIIDISQQNHCLDDIISSYPLYGEQLKNTIKEYCGKHPKHILEDGALSAFLCVPELYNDEKTTKNIFEYLAASADPLQLIKYYPKFDVHWKKSYWRVICAHRYSPVSLINSGLVEIIEKDDYFLFNYPKGLNLKDIGDGAFEDYVALFNGKIISAESILDLACRKNKLENLKTSLGWDNNDIRLIILSNGSLPLLTDFENKVQLSPLREEEVTQFNNWPLYDEWLIMLVTKGHEEPFLADLIKQRLEANHYSIFFINRLFKDCTCEAQTYVGSSNLLSEFPRNFSEIDFLKKYFDEAFIIDAIKYAANRRIVIPFTTLLRYYQQDNEIFSFMCAHPDFADFGEDKSLNDLSLIYRFASESNKETMISCLGKHFMPTLLLQKLDKDPSGDQNFRGALKHEAIRKLILTLRNNGIECFYHFTDARNYESIKENGLLPHSEIEKKRIPCKRGGDRVSNDIDENKKSNEYVHLSFCKDTAMGYNRFSAKGDNEKQLCFKIDLEILYFLTSDQDFVKFTPVNAATNGITLQNLSTLSIDYNACKTSLKVAAKEKETHPEIYANRQAEILVKYVPQEYINNLKSPLRDEQIYI